MNYIGYARVSTTGQTLGAQIEKLSEAGCNTIFQEKVSGAKINRVEFQKLLNKLENGDVLVVTRLDRLARSTSDLLKIVNGLEVKGSRLKSLAEPWADTTTPSGKLMLTIMGGLAELERSLIVERTSEGRERAKLAGRKFGRPSKLSRYQINEARRMKSAGETNAEIARFFDVSRSTISRISITGR